MFGFGSLHGGLIFSCLITCFTCVLQISEFKTILNIVNFACEEVRNSCKLKEIMKKILCLGNTLNQGTAMGKLYIHLLKLSKTRASNSKMTLMHYLCKVLATRTPELLKFHLDLVSLEATSKVQLKYLAEKMQAIIKGLEKVKQELAASEDDGPVSEGFREVHCCFTALYSSTFILNICCILQYV
ncbi:hypothetical protein GOBAR_AA28407 [Gossypium barbadense]|uniref:FH2 domain-containing protein n=1 Tax=Gossypium barbadense TaxID=3634 RepID=A0A2P5WMD2_GOSBA|nr:hypothetical protein GOBAR_AA28407 [Gossypium barbadense]